MAFRFAYTAILLVMLLLPNLQAAGLSQQPRADDQVRVVVNDLGDGYESLSFHGLGKLEDLGPLRDDDIDMDFLQKMNKKEKDPVQKKIWEQSINDIYKQRAHLDSSIHKILFFLFGTVNAPAILESELTEMRSPSLDDCHAQACYLFEVSCGELGDYGSSFGLKMMLRKICEAGASIFEIKQACQAVCPAKKHFQE